MTNRGPGGVNASSPAGDSFRGEGDACMRQCSPHGVDRTSGAFTAFQNADAGQEEVRIRNACEADLPACLAEGLSKLERQRMRFWVIGYVLHVHVLAVGREV